MGTNKASVELNGKAMLERVLERLGGIFTEVIISAHGDERYSYPGIPVVTDALKGRGPAVGLCSALAVASNPWVFIVACDQPLVSPELARKLAGMREGFDCVVPRAGGKVQTTCAMYNRTCLHPLTERVKKGSRGLVSFLRETPLRVRYVEDGELRTADPELKSFIDVDTPEDVGKAEKIIKPKE
jgi:molybdopterin-guanine dinucleotide biosynthesis protein A